MGLPYNENTPVIFPAPRPLVLCLAGLLAAPLAAQQTREAPALPAANHNLIFLDPAHGGSDNGAHLKDNLLEKDLTLALSARIKATLAAKGFQVVTTRDGDTDPTSDQRAELANHIRPFVCLLIHASNSGFGPYLAASSLTPTPEERIALPWDTAQSGSVSDSLALLDVAGKAFTTGSIPATTLRSSVPPIDSLTCPALLLELAPLAKSPITDTDYQQSVADALTAAIVSWKQQADTALPKPAAKARAAKPAGGAQ